MRGGRPRCARCRSRRPLMRASRAFSQFPVMPQKHVKIAIVPCRWRMRPCAFDAAGDGVAALAAAIAVFPAQTLFFDRCGFGFRPDKAVVARAMRFAKSMPARDQRNGFFVIHRHTGKGFANIARRCDRIGIAVWTLRVNIDQSHLHRAQRIGQFAVAAVTLIAQPFGFGAPVNIFFGLPNIGAAAAETECLETHRFERAIAGEHQQIRPRQLTAIFLLHRPKQAAGFIEIGVIGPAVQRRETLGSR